MGPLEVLGVLGTVPNGEVSPGEETQGDHAGGITTVTGVGTDAVARVMRSLGQVRKMLGSQDQSEHRQSSWKDKDEGEGRRRQRPGNQRSASASRRAPLCLPHPMQYK